MKDLPVLETARSLLGVDIKLKEGETKECELHSSQRSYRHHSCPLVTYTLELPKNLPPAHRGRAYRFSYDFVLSLTVLLPDQGNRQKSKDIHVPIRIWANVSLAKPLRSYDVLRPIIQTKDEAKVESISARDGGKGRTAVQRRRSSAGESARMRAGDTAESLATYASHLLETVDRNQEVDGRTSPRAAPLSPSKVNAMSASSLSPYGALDAQARKSGEPHRPPSDRLEIPNGHASGTKPRQGSFVKGDDELVAEATEDGGCGQAVEVLSRHSTKSESGRDKRF